MLFLDLFLVVWLLVYGYLVVYSDIRPDLTHFIVFLLLFYMILHIALLENFKFTSNFMFIFIHLVLFDSFTSIVLPDYRYCIYFNSVFRIYMDIILVFILT